MTGVVLHRSRRIRPEHETARAGPPCHRPERALLDVAAARPRRAGALLAAGVQEGLTTPDRLRSYLLDLPPRIRGRAELVRIVEDIAGGTRSELERRCLWLLRRAGLPEPSRDHEVALAGRRARIDLAYPDALVAIETDGRAFHLGAAAWRRDLERQNALVVAGWLVLRFTGAYLRTRPDRVVAQVRAALAERVRMSTP